ncbi:hypothetical protein D3C87_2047140 [compost metagenome]
MVFNLLECIRKRVQNACFPVANNRIELRPECLQIGVLANGEQMRRQFRRLNGCIGKICFGKIGMAVKELLYVFD